MSDLHREIRQLPAQDKRVETGALQFGDDWPGVFIRGDDAGYFAHLLKGVLDLSAESGPVSLDPLTAVLLRSLQSMLCSAIVGPAREIVELQPLSSGVPSMPKTSLVGVVELEQVVAEVNATPAAHSPAAAPAASQAAEVGEGKTWGFFDAAGKPVGGQGAERWTCPKGHWEANTYRHDITGDVVSDEENPNRWVSECQLGRQPGEAKKDTCPCGMVFLYP